MSETKSTGKPLSLAEIARLQEIEDNPFTSDEIAMFEMFEREGWSPERQRDYMLASMGLRNTPSSE